MRLTRLWLVRHGQSTWNAQGRIQGQSGEGLSDLGRRQAKTVARWLAATIGTAPVITSDLERAVETAEHVAEALGVRPRQDPAVRERNFGRWEGRLPEEVETGETDLWDAWASGTRDVISEVGGESLAVLGDRVVAALEGHVEVARADGHDHIVVVSHGGVVWQGLHRLLDLPDLVLSGVGNTAVSTVAFTDDHRWLETFNSMAHLEPDDTTMFRPRELDHRD